MRSNKWNYVPWDSLVFGINCYEASNPSIEQLAFAFEQKGHYTARVTPLHTKADLQRYGFYYCDTLLEPYAAREDFLAYENPKVSVQNNPTLDAILSISRDAFAHGRFHRDFNLPLTQAEHRYENWLIELYQARLVYGLLYEGCIAGFIAVKNNSLALHAIANQFRGKGLAKYLWTPVCQSLFDNEAPEITSSISAANLAVLNLYASLGFRFRNPVDVYHRLNS